MQEKDQNNDHEELVPETEDIYEEESELIEDEANIQQVLKSLREKVKQCEREKRENLEELQRVRADFLNSKRRLEEQLNRDRERIEERFLAELLPLADSFDMAMKNPAWKEASETWQAGVLGIYNQLMNLLKQCDVEVLEPLGEHFNPHEHEALADNGTNDIVSEVIQKGYKRGERVLRPAKVAVGTKEA